MGSGELHDVLFVKAIGMHPASVSSLTRKGIEQLTINHECIQEEDRHTEWKTSHRKQGNLYAKCMNEFPICQEFLI